MRELNDYLRKYAFANHQNRSARTYVALRGEQVVGYYTLAAGSVSPLDTPRRVVHGQAGIRYRSFCLPGWLST